MTLYKLLETFWAKYLLGPDSSPFVVIVDLLFSKCHYCLFWRGVILGAALTAILTGHFIVGVFLLALTGALAWAERKYG